MVGGLDAAVKAAVDAAVKKFQVLGAEIVEISPVSYTHLLTWGR